MSELWKLGIMLVVGFLVAYGGILVSLFLGPRRPTPTKDYPYESGIQVKGDAHGKVAIKYFLVALIFLVFDVEVAVLLPWAVKVADMKVIAAVEGGVFLAVLLVAYLYALGKDAIRWLD
ncbi:MAG: NADH-quinone oxidoreductase subunit A [Thermotogae bacterium]|nr:NADH-quinone oxidoreductase subunit A [Thermotogota bacterium]